MPAEARPTEEPVLRVQEVSKRYGSARRSGQARAGSIFERLRGSASEIDPVDDEDEDEAEELDPEEPPARDSETWALRNISFEVGRGKTMAIVGPNGAGKTTLLKVLPRITPPTLGRAEFRGRVAPMLDLASTLMHPELTGRQNVLLLARFFGFPREVALRQLDEIADFAELEDLDVRAKRYSTGQFRRLAFSAAINLEPDVLLADEVLAVGDAAFRERCLARVAQLTERGLTLLLATHDMRTVRETADEAILLRAGVLVARGKADEVARLHEGPKARGRQPVGVPGARAEGPVGDRSSPPPAKRSFNAHATIYSAHVLATDGHMTTGLATEALAVDQEAAIEILLEVATSGIRVKCGLEIMRGTTSWLKLRQPKAFIVKRSGWYAVRVSLPGGILCRGVYEGRAGALVVAGGEQTRITRPGAFRLRVADPLAPDGSDRSEAATPPIIQDDSVHWTVERSGKALSRTSGGVPAPPVLHADPLSPSSRIPSVPDSWH